MKLLHTPTVCSIARLVVALQVLMTLGMPLRTTTTTTALPVTSKPIESTAENLAWQAWIMLPPEQKQLIKSRKVTPKSIFTLPLRVECPEGHQQVDMKCIPTAIGSNSVLIDPNVLGLVLGDAPVDIEYDYEDETLGDNQGGNFPYNPPLYLSDTEKSNSDAVLELKPPSKDEPLKFNIFQSKFPTDDYPMEDYSSVSNEGGLQAPAMGENEVNHTQTEGSHSQTHNQIPVNVNLVNESFNNTFNVQEQDLLSEASSNVSKAQSLTGLTESSAFSLDNLEAISLPASSSSQAEKSQTFSLFNEDTAIHLVTSIMDTESSEDESKEMSTTQQNQENDLEVLLQTESLMPMLNQTTASTIQPAESLALTSTTLEEPQSSSSKVSENFALHLEDIEEMTTLIPNVMEGQRDIEEHEDKVEYIRSVTMNPLYSDSVEGDEDEVTTLTPSTGYDEPSEMQEESESVETTAMPAATIQLDETTIIEGVNDEVLSNDETTTLQLETTSSSSSFAALQSSTQTPEELQEMLRQQEQAVQDFEELQRMRKGQITDQHTVQQKSKVEPVEVSAALFATTTATQSAAEATMPAESTTTKTTATTMDELITAETVTPLLTVHNNDSNSNDNTKTNNINNNIEHNNDRFYYQHFAKQDLESAALVSGGITTKATEETSTPTAATSTMSSSNTATVDWETTSPSTATTSTTAATGAAATSEIDLAEELRLINELVKGKRPGTSSATTTTTVDTSSSKPAATTTTETSAEDDETNISSSTSQSSATSSSAPKPSESSAASIKYSLETTQIWSKIMPLIKTTSKTSTTTTTTTTTTSTPANLKKTTENSSTSAATAQEEETTTANNNLVASNRSHRNSKIIRINGLNSIDTNPKKSSVTPQTTETTATTTTEDIFSSTAAEDTTSAAAADAYEPFWWLPIAWRLDTPSTTTKKPEQSNHSNDDDMPLLLRFWSTYHAPKSS